MLSNQKYQKNFLLSEIFKLIFGLLLIVFFSLYAFLPIYQTTQGDEVIAEHSGFDIITMVLQNTSLISVSHYGGALLSSIFCIFMVPYMLWRIILFVITLYQYDLYMEFQYCRELFCIKRKQRNPVVKMDTASLFLYVLITSFGCFMSILSTLTDSRTTEQLTYTINLTAIIVLLGILMLLFSIQIVRSVYSSKLSEKIRKEYYLNPHDNT